MLRNRVPDDLAAYPDPVLGVNLRDALSDLLPGEAEQLANCYFDGGLRKRLGSNRLNASTLGAYSGRGGTKFYPNTATSFRVVAYNTLLATVSNAGAIGTISNSLTADTNVWMTSWPVTDRLYVVNGNQTLAYVSATQNYNTLTGTNIPATPSIVMPYLDRLFAIQSSVVVSSNPRSDGVWAPITSSWAAYRPIAGAGPPTALWLHSSGSGDQSTEAQLLIFQRSAVTALRATDLGGDVTAAAAPSGWNARMEVIDPSIGTESPYAITTVPGLGTFWFTADFNLAWLPFGRQAVLLIGDKLISNRTDILGLNNVNANALANVEMKYHDRKLKLFLPVSGNSYSTRQYWLDLRPLQLLLAGVLAGSVAVLPVSWSGPHSGQSLRRPWNENQGGDSDALYALEGNSANGMFVYQLNIANRYTDAQGTTDANTAFTYATFYHPFGVPTFRKYIPEIRVDASGDLRQAGMTIRDLHDFSVSSLGFRTNAGALFTYYTYNGGFLYDGTSLYSQSVQHTIARVNVRQQTASSVMVGDAIQLRVTHSQGAFILHSLIPDVQISKTKQVS